jgi:hypothetical protein
MTTKTVTLNGVSATFKRKTNLSDARFRAIANKMSFFYKRLSEEVHESPDVVDLALSDLARIASQNVELTGAPFSLPLPTDTEEELYTKSLVYLIEVDPDLAALWKDTTAELNRTWSDRATGPEPLERDTDPS